MSENRCTQQVKMAALKQLAQRDHLFSVVAEWLGISIHVRVRSILIVELQDQLTMRRFERGSSQFCQECYLRGKIIER